MCGENMLISHTRIVVQECYNGDGKEKIDPSPRQNPLPMLTSVGMSDVTRHANCIALPWGVFVAHIRDFPYRLGWPAFAFFLGGGVSYNLLLPTPLNGFLQRIRQKTSFQPRMCLLRIPMTTINIQTLKFAKNCHFEHQILTGLGFFALENRLNMGVLLNYP